MAQLRNGRGRQWARPTHLLSHTITSQSPRSHKCFRLYDLFVIPMQEVSTLICAMTLCFLLIVVPSIKMISRSGVITCPWLFHPPPASGLSSVGGPLHEAQGSDFEATGRLSRKPSRRLVAMSLVSASFGHVKPPSST